MIGAISPHNWERGVFAGQGEFSHRSLLGRPETGTHFHVEALQALYPSVGKPTATSGSSPDPRRNSRRKTSGFLLG